MATDEDRASTRTSSLDEVSFTSKGKKIWSLLNETWYSIQHLSFECSRQLKLPGILGELCVDAQLFQNDALFIL